MTHSCSPSTDSLLGGQHLLYRLILWLCFFSTLFHGTGHAAETFILEHPRTINTLTGFTQPRAVMTITSEVTGRCLTMSGEIGDTLQPGTPLVTIDPTFILLEINTNTLARQKQKKTIALNKQELERYQHLRAGHSTPQATLDRVHLQYDIALIELDNLVNKGTRLREQHDRHTISGPTGYQIIDRLIEPGEYITTGQPLARLGNFRELLIPLVLSYDEYQALRALSPIPVYLPDLELTLQATLLRTSPEFDKKSRKIKVDLLLPEKEVDKLSTLHGGLRVQIQLTLHSRTGSYLVPASAVRERHEYYWLTTSKGVSRQVVFLGQAQQEGYVLISGSTLRAGEHFLTQPTN